MLITAVYTNFEISKICEVKAYSWVSFQTKVTLSESVGAYFLEVSLGEILSILAKTPVVMETEINYALSHFQIILKFTFFLSLSADMVFPWPFFLNWTWLYLANFQMDFG